MKNKDIEIKQHLQISYLGFAIGKEHTTLNIMNKINEKLKFLCRFFF